MLHFGCSAPATHDASMNGANHALSGVAAYGAALVVGVTTLDQTMPSSPVVVLGGVVAVGAALAADIDERNSKASQVAGPLGSFLRLFTGSHRTRTHWPLVVIPVLTAWCWYLISYAGAGWAFGVTCGLLVALGWPFATAAILPKRNEKFVAFFSIPAGVALAWWIATEGYVPDWWLYAAVPIPYFTHLLGDTPTPAGIAWLGPFSKHKFSARLFHSGGSFELSVVTPLLFLACGWGAWRLFQLGAFAGPWVLP